LRESIHIFKLNDLTSAYRIGPVFLSWVVRVGPYGSKSHLICQVKGKKLVLKIEEVMFLAFNNNTLSMSECKLLSWISQIHFRVNCGGTLVIRDADGSAAKSFVKEGFMEFLSKVYVEECEDRCMC
jgi:hypothetical protein